MINLTAFPSVDYHDFTTLMLIKFCNDTPPLKICAKFQPKFAMISLKVLLLLITLSAMPSSNL